MLLGLQSRGMHLPEWAIGYGLLGCSGKSAAGNPSAVLAGCTRRRMCCSSGAGEVTQGCLPESDAPKAAAPVRIGPSYQIFLSKSGETTCLNDLVLLPLVKSFSLQAGLQKQVNSSQSRRLNCYLVALGVTGNIGLIPAFVRWGARKSL